MITNGISVAMEGIRELRELLTLAELAGVDPRNVQVDLSMVRGLGYYTGPIFETILTDRPELGSVFAGGRYDNLVGRFSNANVPATGASFGIDRFMTYASSEGLYDTPLSMNQVLVAYQSDTLEVATQVTTQLRAVGVRSLLYDGQDLSFRQPIGHANALKIPWVIIVGAREVAGGEVALKDMLKRTQSTMSMVDAIQQIQRS